MQIADELRSSQKFCLARRSVKVVCFSYTTSGATPAERILGRTLRAGILREICRVKVFTKVSTFAENFALHLIPQNTSAVIMDLHIGSRAIGRLFGAVTRLPEGQPFTAHLQIRASLEHP